MILRHSLAVALAILLFIPAILQAAPIHDAAQTGAVGKAVHILDADPSQVRVRNELGWTPLQWAVAYGQVSVAQALLARGADSKDRLGHGQATLLHLAVIHHQKTMVTFLLDGGADPNAIDRYGETPLHSAAFWGDLDIADLLLSHGAKADVRSKAGWTPLHTAARFGRSDVIRLLLDKGADVDARDALGKTPLHRAAEGGDRDTVALLLARSADLTRKDKAGETALDRALAEKHPGIVALLRASDLSH